MGLAFPGDVVPTKIFYSALHWKDALTPGKEITNDVMSTFVKLVQRNLRLVKKDYTKLIIHDGTFGAPRQDGQGVKEKLGEEVIRSYIARVVGRTNCVEQGWEIEPEVVEYREERDSSPPKVLPVGTDYNRCGVHVLRELIHRSLLLGLSCCLISWSTLTTLPICTFSSH